MAAIAVEANNAIFAPRYVTDNTWETADATVTVGDNQIQIIGDYTFDEATVLNSASLQNAYSAINNRVNDMIYQGMGIPITLLNSGTSATTAGSITDNLWYGTDWGTTATTATNSITVQYDSSQRLVRITGYAPERVDLKAGIRRQIKENMRSSVQRNRTHLDWSQATPAELKARETLREMIPESEWRRYVANAFIMVRGASGNWYQIFGRRGERLRVYRDGKHIQSICIHTDNRCPPTDHVLNMKFLVEFDEQAVLAGGNISQISHYEKPKLHVVKAIPVVDLKKELPKRYNKYGGTTYNASALDHIFAAAV